jgi:hypothetical protein
VAGYKPYQVWAEKSKRWIYKQHVDVFYAFHKAGFKASARSFNVVQEDIDHWLKYGTVRHGEWFMGGERLPGGDHRQPLPASSQLREAPRHPPDFPEMDARKDKFDGCPNQFSYSTNYHQVADWLPKTAEWHAPAAAAAAAEASDAQVAADAAEAQAEAARATAFAAAASANAAVTEDAHDVAAGAVSTSLRLSAASTRAATAAAAIAGFSGGIVRTGNKLIEYEGKGSCDGYGNVPKHALKHAIESGALINPGTRELVLHRAVLHSAVHCTSTAPRVLYRTVQQLPRSTAPCSAATVLHREVLHRSVLHRAPISVALINPGTRELVLYMAEHKQEPAIPKARKNGWEAVDRYFWGYVDTARFTKAAVPDADSWKGSKSFHEYVGRCADRQRAESIGPLQVPWPSKPRLTAPHPHFTVCGISRSCLTEVLHPPECPCVCVCIRFAC